jgi:hypothetical protein
MGLAFPLVLMLTAVAWLVVAAVIVLSWFSSFANSIARMWRICTFLTVSLSLLPIVVACAEAIGALKYGGTILPALMILVCAFLPPLVCLLMLRRDTRLPLRSPLTNGSSDRAVASSVSKGEGEGR